MAFFVCLLASHQWWKRDAFSVDSPSSMTRAVKLRREQFCCGEGPRRGGEEGFHGLQPNRHLRWHRRWRTAAQRRDASQRSGDRGVSVTLYGYPGFSEFTPGQGPPPLPRHRGISIYTYHGGLPLVKACDTVPAEFNQPDVWRRGVIVHVPLQQDARSAAITRSATTNADVVGICDEWFFVVRGSKHPIHVISEFAVHCKGSASRVAKGRGSIPLSTIVERLERVPQLAGRLPEVHMDDEDALAMLHEVEDGSRRPHT